MFGFDGFLMENLWFVSSGFQGFKGCDVLGGGFMGLLLALYDPHAAVQSFKSKPTLGVSPLRLRSYWVLQLHLSTLAFTNTLSLTSPIRALNPRP